MDGFPWKQTRLLSDGKHQFTFRYQDSDSLAFTVQPGQTVWIGKDRKPHITWAQWTVNEVKSLERLSGATGIRVSSLDELRTAITTLKAEQDGAADGSQSFHSQINRTSGAAGSRR